MFSTKPCGHGEKSPARRREVFPGLEARLALAAAVRLMGAPSLETLAVQTKGKTGNTFKG